MSKAKDWTVDPVTHRSNSSKEFKELSDFVGEIIRSSAFDLIAGRSDNVGHLVMAQLAHIKGLRPPTKRKK